jgi:hypothetical protein
MERTCLLVTDNRLVVRSGLWVMLTSQPDSEVAEALRPRSHPRVVLMVVD